MFHFYVTLTETLWSLYALMAYWYDWFMIDYFSVFLGSWMDKWLEKRADHWSLEAHISWSKTSFTPFQSLFEHLYSESTFTLIISPRIVGSLIWWRMNIWATRTTPSKSGTFIGRWWETCCLTSLHYNWQNTTAVRGDHLYTKHHSNCMETLLRVYNTQTTLSFQNIGK